MAQYELTAETRKEIGTGASRRMRKDKFIPAVLYGQSDAALPLKVAYEEFDRLRRAAKSEHAVIDLAVKESGKKVHAMIKNVDHDPIKGDPIHIDFLAISLDKKIITKVSVVSVGECPGVAEGGILDHPLWELEVRCLPRGIPEKIEVDVTALALGSAILVKDLKVPANIEIVTEPAQVVFSVVKQKEEIVAAAAEGEEAKEPEVITAKKPEEGEAAAGEEDKGKEKGKEKAKDKEKK